MNTSIKTKEELENEVKNLFESLKVDAEKIMAACPEWKVIDADCTSWVAEVYLAFAGDNRMLEIRYARYHGMCEKETFTTNVATVGSFELLDNNEMAQYYIAVGSLLSKKEMLSQMKGIMKKAVESACELRKMQSECFEE